MNSKFIEACFEKLKNERDNIEFVEKYLKIFNDKNLKEENLKKKSYLIQAISIKWKLILMIKL